MTNSSTITTTAPRLYVGTYAKYNSGSIKGAWLDLEDFDDRDEFLAACRELHKDEADPELMFQDFEGFPKSMYSESSVSEELFARIALDEDDRELLAVYCDNINSDGNIEEARDRFMGKADTKRAWAEQYLEETEQLSELPKWAENYFDFEAYAHDAEVGGDVSFVRHDGDLWVFSSN